MDGKRIGLIVALEDLIHRKIDYQGDYIIERELTSGNAGNEISKTLNFLKSIQWI